MHAVYHTRVLHDDLPEVQPANDPLRQRGQQEIPGVLLLGEHLPKELVMGFVDRGMAVVGLVDLLHTLNNGQRSAGASTNGKPVAGGWRILGRRSKHRILNTRNIFADINTFFAIKLRNFRNFGIVNHDCIQSLFQSYRRK